MTSPAGRLAVLNIPRHSGSLLGVYEVQAGDWKGFGFGGGGPRRRLAPWGQRQRAVPAPGYVLTDALAYYRYENLRFGLNVDNIFDETYYERSYNAFWVGVGEPRRVDRQHDGSVLMGVHRGRSGHRQERRSRPDALPPSTPCAGW